MEILNSALNSSEFEELKLHLSRILQNQTLERLAANGSPKERQNVAAVVPGLLDSILRALRDCDSDSDLQASCLRVVAKCIEHFSQVIIKKAQKGPGLYTNDMVRGAARRFCDSQFPNVQLGALAILRRCLKLTKIDRRGLDTVKRLLVDATDSGVRSEALEYLSDIVELNGASGYFFDESMANEAFYAIASAVLDNEPVIRSKACICMSLHRNISLSLFKQMLSKKPCLDGLPKVVVTERKPFVQQNNNGPSQPVVTASIGSKRKFGLENEFLYGPDGKRLTKAEQARMKRENQAKLRREQEMERLQKIRRTSSSSSLTEMKEPETAELDPWVGEGDYVLSNDSEVVQMEESTRGAFLHALEDEYEEVRKSGVDAMFRICQVRPYFDLAFEFFVDMLNDEIDEVRTLTLQRLFSLSSTFNKSFPMKPEQLETILSVLNDAAPERRRLARKLIGNLKNIPREMILSVLESVLRGFRYPDDEHESILDFFKDFGVTYGIEFGKDNLAIQLLGADSKFPIPNKPIADRKYSSFLVMFKSATDKFPRLTNSFPDNMKRHIKFVTEYDSSRVTLPPKSKTTVMNMILSKLRMFPKEIEFLKQTREELHAFGLDSAEDRFRIESLRLWLKCYIDYRELKQLLSQFPFSDETREKARDLLGSCYELIRIKYHESFAERLLRVARIAFNFTRNPTGIKDIDTIINENWIPEISEARYIKETTNSCHLDMSIFEKSKSKTVGFHIDAPLKVNELMPVRVKVTGQCPKSAETISVNCNIKTGPTLLQSATYKIESKTWSEDGDFVTWIRLPALSHFKGKIIPSDLVTVEFSLVSSVQLLDPQDIKILRAPYYTKTKSKKVLYLVNVDKDKDK